MQHAEQVRKGNRGTVTWTRDSFDRAELAMFTANAIGNLWLAMDEDDQDFDDAVAANKDNDFWDELHKAGACMEGLTIVSGVENWHDLIDLIERLHRWDWAAWVLEKAHLLDLEPDDHIYEEFARLA